MSQHPVPSLAWIPPLVFRDLVGVRAILRGHEATIIKIDDIDHPNPTFAVIFVAEDRDAAEGGVIIWERNIPLGLLRLKQSWHDRLRHLVALVPPEHYGLEISRLVVPEVTAVNNKLLRHPLEVSPPGGTLPWEVQEVTRPSSVRPTFTVQLRKGRKHKPVAMHVALEKVSPDGEQLNYEG